MWYKREYRPGPTPHRLSVLPCQKPSQCPQEPRIRCDHWPVPVSRRLATRGSRKAPRGASARQHRQRPVSGSRCRRRAAHGGGRARAAHP